MCVKLCQAHYRSQSLVSLGWRNDLDWFGYGKVWPYKECGNMHMIKATARHFKCYNLNVPLVMLVINYDKTIRISIDLLTR